MLHSHGYSNEMIVFIFRVQKKIMFRVTAIKSLLGLGLGVSGKRLRSGFGL